MRADRLLSLLLLLQSKGKIKARELAERLEISPRTVYRDVEALAMAGVPVHAQSGPGGGIRLVEDYRTDLSGLSTDEARALIALPNARSSLSDIGLEGPLRTALAKLVARLPTAQQIAAEHLRERLHIDSTPWFEGKEAVPHLSVIREAVWTDRKLELGYRNRAGRLSEAVVEPYGLVIKFDHWYLVAETPRGTRVYRVARVTGAKLLDEIIVRRPDFNLVRYWEQWQSLFVANLPSYEVTLAVSSEAEKELRERGFRWRRVDGETMLFDFQREDIALRNLLLLGRAIEIREPISLRARVAEIARELRDRYPVERGKRTTHH